MTESNEAPRRRGRPRTRPLPESTSAETPYADAPAPRRTTRAKRVETAEPPAPGAGGDGGDAAPVKRPRGRPRKVAAEATDTPSPAPEAAATPRRPARRRVASDEAPRAESAAPVPAVRREPPPQEAPRETPRDLPPASVREPRLDPYADGPRQEPGSRGMERPTDGRPERQWNDRRERGGRRRGRHRHRQRERQGEGFDAGSGERPGMERPAMDRPMGDRPMSDRPMSDRPMPERPMGDRSGGYGQDAGGDRYDGQDRGFRRGRRGRNRFRRGGPPTQGGNEPAFERTPHTPLAVEGTMSGWFDASRDGGFLRRAVNSYLPDPTDPFLPPALVRLHQLRRGDKLDVTYGRDHRGRYVVVEVQALNDGSPVVLDKRPDFNTLVASYPDRKLTLETGRPAKTGPELTRRAIDLIAPIGYGQRALIVAPARAGKTTLLQAIVEGVAINHPQAVLLVLLVDERPEEVSEMITWGYGEVVASSFDMPPKRHVEVAEMTLERARRLVETGKDVVIVLDSITRMARAHNAVDRGTGRTMSGGLDATAMQKPKAFFGSARMIAPQHGGGSLTIIATALVETGSRMDDVIFEEFKGTGNCEIKLDRSLADRRIFPAFDIATSGTRREEKLYRPDQLDKVHLLRRGLHQLPPQAGMEWLIKRIAATTNNDSLLDGL